MVGPNRSQPQYAESWTGCTIKCIEVFAVYFFSCPANVTGPTCEDDVDECVVANPCLNGATCLNVFGSYQCRCINGWEGKDCAINTDDCELSSESDPPRCQNGGQCIDRVGKYDCNCTPGYVGELSKVNL